MNTKINTYCIATKSAIIVEPVSLSLSNITYSQYKSIVSALNEAFAKGKILSSETKQTSEMFSG